MNKIPSMGAGIAGGARRSAKRPTVADVARVAGVSPMTVSRVINAAGTVLDDTRDKVKQAIAELGYVPNPAARSLAGGRYCRIAMLYDNPSAAFLSELVMGSLTTASELDVELQLEDCSNHQSPEKIVAHLMSHRVDGIILPPPLCENTALLNAIQKEALPYVGIATTTSSDNALSIAINDRQAAFDMTRFLVANGHRRIGFICGNENQSASKQRQQGYTEALEASGIPFDSDLIAAGDFTYRSGMLAAESLLSLTNRPTAIFASNDDMAAAVTAIAHRHRIDVPEGLSVCGFDDTAMAVSIWPELTTIRQPVSKMASFALEWLVARINSTAGSDQKASEHKELDFTLVERGSVTSLD